MTRTGAAGRLTRNRVIAPVLKVALVANVALMAWVLGVQGPAGPAPVVPDTDTQFSLDLEVINTIDHGTVYAVEQRARPNYRIFSLDPATGTIDTVFTVPEDAVIYGIALHPDRTVLAVAYSPDHHLGGNGMSLLDLRTGQLTQITPVTSDTYLTDPAWSSDGETILATFVDRTAEQENLSAVRIDVASTRRTTLADNAINPVQAGDAVFFLAVEDDKARHAIGTVDPNGTRTAIAVGDASSDLDHLTAHPTSATLAVAALQAADTGPTIGDPADAHGNHDRPSTWWNVNLATRTATPTATPAIVTYDAAATTRSIVSATSQGLTITHDGEQTDLIASRAIRFVAA